MATRRSALRVLGALPAGGVLTYAKWSFAETQVRIVPALAAATHCIGWMGVETGVFAKYGITASVPRTEMTGPESIVGLHKGDWDFANTGAVPIAEDVLKGGDGVVLLRAFDPHQDLYVVTRRELSSLADLDGKKVGVLSDAYSGQTGVKTRLAVEKSGANAVYVGLGTYQNIYNAFARGEVDGAALPVHLRLRAERELQARSYPAQSFSAPSVFATTRAFLSRDRGATISVVKGYLETIHFFKSQPDATASLLQKFLKIDDHETALDLQKFYAPIFPKVPSPDFAGDALASLRNALRDRYPRAVSLEERDFTDASIIDEVVKSGFVETLYNRP